MRLLLHELFWLPCSSRRVGLTDRGYHLLSFPEGLGVAELPGPFCFTAMSLDAGKEQEMIQQHRFSEHLNTNRLPRPVDRPIAPGSFLCYPAGWLRGLSSEQRLAQERLYAWAFEQARAVARPSLLERDLLGTWN